MRLGVTSSLDELGVTLRALQELSAGNKQPFPTGVKTAPSEKKPLSKLSVKPCCTNPIMRNTIPIVRKLGDADCLILLINISLSVEQISVCQNSALHISPKQVVIPSPNNSQFHQLRGFSVLNLLVKIERFKNQQT